MSYKREWNASPNFTPGSQTQAIYGKPRSIQFGAGHWWNTPEAGASHNGVVSIFKNPARQASAHAVLSDGRVTEMVRAGDTAWATNNANPFTYAIEVDPRIMYKWGWGKPSASQKALAQRIFETLAEYIADKRYHNLTWYPHKKWIATQCNPIHWNEVMVRAKQIRAAKDKPPEPPKPEWIKNLKDITDVKLMVLQPTAVIYDLNTGKQVGSPIPQGTWIDIAKQTIVGGKTYLISKYSVDNAMPNGILKGVLGVPPPDPEPEPSPSPEPDWLEKWQDIADIDMYTRKEGVEVVNLLDGSTTTTIKAKGTKVAIASSTEWMGQKFMITKYSTDKKLPHGIRLVDLDIKPLDPGTDPIPPDPERPVDEIIKENNSLLKQILELLQKVWDAIFNR